MTFKFGDILENESASKNNSIRVGIFVRKTSKGFECTDGKGKFWVVSARAATNKKLNKIGSALKD